MDDLREWLLENGVQQFKVDLSDQISGIVAVENIQQGDCIAKIPRDLIITVSKVKKKYKFIKNYPHLFNEALSEDFEFNTLVLWVLLEEKYQPYFKYVKYPKNGIAGSDVQDVNLQIVLKNMQIGLQKNYQYFNTLFDERHLILDYDKFIWAYQLVTTRCFGGDGELGETALVVWGDMMNHHDKSQIDYRMREHQLEFYATENIKKGDEVYNLFGEHTNGFLLAWYGFAYEDNIYDRLYYQNTVLSCMPFQGEQIILKKYKLNKKIPIEKYPDLLEVVEQAITQQTHYKELLNSQLMIVKMHRIYLQTI